MNEMALFEERPVRRAFHNEEWWFVLTDIVSALTDSPAPSDYLKKLRRRDPSMAEVFKRKRSSTLEPLEAGRPATCAFCL
jgi:prophage antirepressor-like protein